MCYSFEKFKQVTVTVCLQARLLWFNFFSCTRGQKLLQWNPDFSNLQAERKLVRGIGRSRNRNWHQITLNWPGFVWLGVSVEILTVIVPFRLMTDGTRACCVIKMRENSLSGSAICLKASECNWRLHYIKVVWKFFAGSSYRGLIRPTGAKIGSSYWEFWEIEGLSPGVWEIGVEIIELEWGKSKGNKVWFEISEGSGNRGFEISGFHCNCWDSSMFSRFHFVGCIVLLKRVIGFQL